MFHDCFHSRSIVETLFILRLFLFFGFSVFNQRTFQLAVAFVPVLLTVCFFVISQANY